MTGWIVSSCALIIAVLLLRLASGNKISARVRCWLWAAVAVRLLVPGMAFSGPAGVVNALPERFSGETAYTSPVTQSSPAPVTTQTAVSSETAAVPASPELWTQPTQAREINWGALLPEIWKYGALAAAVWFALGNMKLYAGLRKTRRRLDMEAEGVPVYETDMIKSPCLFGFFRPAIYLTPRAAEYGRADWVLKHEFAHLRRGDNWLCLVRCLCLAIWWWNPLAWLAAAKSREDGELACDEAVTAAMPREERLSYGGALLDMVAVGRASAGLSKAAAMMTAGGREMKNRLEALAKEPRYRAPAAAITLALALVLTGCAFTGAKTPAASSNDTAGDTTTLTAEEIRYFNTEFFNGSDSESMLHNNIANDSFDTPQGVNLFQMFYNGTGNDYDRPLTDKEKSLLGISQAETDVNIMLAGNMDKELEKNLCVTLAGTAGRGLALFTYDADAKIYYHMHGDTNYCPVKVLSGYRHAADPDMVYLTCTSGPSSSQKTIGLKKTADGYVFVSSRLDFLTAVQWNLTDESLLMQTAGPAAVDYADGNIIVFHGSYGLFVYDIKAGKITRALNFVNTLGANFLNGDLAVNVVAAADGSAVEAALAGNSELAAAYCLHPETAWYVETGYGDAGWIKKTGAIVEDGKASYCQGEPGQIKNPAKAPECMLKGDRLSNLTLSINGKSYKLFDGWKFAAEAVSIEPADYGITQDMLRMITPVDFTAMSLPAMGAYFLSVDGAGSEGGADELLNRFMADPVSVLGYIDSIGAEAVTPAGETAQTQLCMAIGVQGGLQSREDVRAKILKVLNNVKKTSGGAARIADLASAIETFAGTEYDDAGVKVRIGPSAKFSEAEIKQAVKVTEDKIRSFRVCTLKSLYYDEAKSDYYVQSYLSSGKGSVNGAAAENTIVLFSDFHTSADAKDAWSPDTDYGWSFTLIRADKNSPWVADDWGY